LVLQATQVGLVGPVGLDGLDRQERLRIQAQQAGQVLQVGLDLLDTEQLVLKVKQVFKVHLEPMANKDLLD
jgi:hypothetical protein